MLTLEQTPVYCDHCLQRGRRVRVGNWQDANLFVLAKEHHYTFQRGKLAVAVFCHVCNLVTVISLDKEV